ncbi:MAG: hypothetical protein NT150_04070 [Bacteroidetes bacterium]|nr:hypothetical protein [Bacteroidota bacterium]
MKVNLILFFLLIGIHAFAQVATEKKELIDSLDTTSIHKKDSVKTITTEAIKINRAVGVVTKNDTIQYNASSYKTNVDATVEELAKKMPGISLENGVLKAQGEYVKKVLLDGKPFF